MREINLPWIFGIVEAMPASKLQEYSQEIQIAQINGQKVLAAAIAVEKEFEKIINARVAGSAGAINAYFAENILGAEWFTYSAKRNLVIKIFAEYDHLKGQDKKDVEHILRKTMSLRNRFAHGHCVVKNGNVYLSYFETHSREDQLSDSFWIDVETTFSRAIELLKKGQKSMGINL